jgi:hypothetical protein
MGLRTYFKYLRKRRKFKLAKRKAKQLSEIYNRRFYIFLKNGEYRVLCKSQLERLKKQGYVHKKACFYDYIKQAVWFTK